MQTQTRSPGTGYSVFGSRPLLPRSPAPPQNLSQARDASVVPKARVGAEFRPPGTSLPVQEESSALKGERLLPCVSGADLGGGRGLPTLCLRLHAGRRGAGSGGGPADSW